MTLFSKEQIKEWENTHKVKRIPSFIEIDSLDDSIRTIQKVTKEGIEIFTPLYIIKVNGNPIYIASDYKYIKKHIDQLKKFLEGKRVNYKNKNKDLLKFLCKSKESSACHQGKLLWRIGNIGECSLEFKPIEVVGSAIIYESNLLSYRQKYFSWNYIKELYLTPKIFNKDF